MEEIPEKKAPKLIVAITKTGFTDFQMILQEVLKPIRANLNLI